jgi:hypothetical protein
MTVEALQYLNNCIESLSIPYEFMQWTKDLSFPYFVGEYTETESINEDGSEQGTLILTGTTNKSYLTLEFIKEKLKDFFPSDGRTAILDSGSGIAVSYSTAFPVPTGEQGLNRIQINLNIKEWRN